MGEQSLNIKCGRRDLNPHAFWAPPPQDGASANFATSAGSRSWHSMNSVNEYRKRDIQAQAKIANSGQFSRSADFTPLLPSPRNLRKDDELRHSFSGGRRHYFVYPGGVGKSLPCPDESLENTRSPGTGRVVSHGLDLQLHIGPVILGAEPVGQDKPPRFGRDVAVRGTARLSGSPSRVFRPCQRRAACVQGLPPAPRKSAGRSGRHA
jgi:hypothetical protein